MHKMLSVSTKIIGNHLTDTCRQIVTNSNEKSLQDAMFYLDKERMQMSIMLRLPGRVCTTSISRRFCGKFSSKRYHKIEKCKTLLSINHTSTKFLRSLSRGDVTVSGAG